MKIILASGSPRRRELMHYITDDFEVCTSNADETIPKTIDPYKAAEHLSVQKALAVAAEHSGDIVIGCDTVVIQNKKIMGKPKDNDDARSMLHLLSDRVHDVITGCAIIYKEKIHSFSEKTSVHFYKLSDKEIDSYINTGEPLDKAGSYGIQGKGALFIKGIEGDYYNVVGLPIAALSRKLNEITEINKGE